MKFANRSSAIALGAALLVTLFGYSLHAKKPPAIPAYDDGEPVFITVVNPNVVGVTQEAIADEAANPIYFVGYYDENGNWVDIQPHVLSIGLAESGYNPYWDVNYVVVDPNTFGCDYTSEKAIKMSGITPIDSHFILLCQQITE